MKRLCKLSELESALSLGFVIDDLPVFAIIRNGMVSVFENRCPHLNLPLEFSPNQFLNFDKSLILCSTHGALFDPGSGLCISGPCAGQSLSKKEHTIENGWLCIR